MVVEQDKKRRGQTVRIYGILLAGNDTLMTATTLSPCSRSPLILLCDALFAFLHPQKPALDPEAPGRYSAATVVSLPLYRIAHTGQPQLWIVVVQVTSIC